MKTVQLIMALHNHQPVGNFPLIFEKACKLSYEPFLTLLDEFPQIRCTLHYSGPLLEWMEENNRPLVDRIIAGVKAGRFELMGGGFGEPILTMLKPEDAIGQIKMYKEHVQRRYGVTLRGAWLTERVWEPYLARIMSEAGVQYIAVDDFHFKAAGLRAHQLDGYYVTEDAGHILNVFSGSEKLRYNIPFRDPEETINYLRETATEDGRATLCYADDGEKFGLWPETYTHVYENGWLRRFFNALTANSEWINFRTFSDVLDSTPPKGRVYLPDASYREMTEWALPSQTQLELNAALDRLDAAGLTDSVRPFMRGGTWRNFKTKFSEAGLLYARMMECSDAVAARTAAKNYKDALKSLYRAQCNCGYWHGVFGGLYMPFLRFALYDAMLRAEAAVATKKEHAGCEIQDWNLDGRPEVKLHTPLLNAYFNPHKGGTLYELDDKKSCHNLLSVMTRRHEAYHEKLLKGARDERLIIIDPNTHVLSNIHDQIRAKEPGLENRLFYDNFTRESLMDHFLPQDADPERLMRGECAEYGDFLGAEYAISRSPSKASTFTLHRQGRVITPNAQAPVELAKRLRLEDNILECRYALSMPEGAPENILFAVEFNIGLMAGNAPDRNYFRETRENLGNLSTIIRLTDAPALGIIDEWLGLEIWLRADPPAGFWTYPVETISESEGGFESVYQGSAILPYWRLTAQPGEEQVVTISLEVRQR